MLNAQDSLSPSAYRSRPPASQPDVDRSLEARRLRKNLLALIRASSGIFPSGNSSIVENLAVLDNWNEDEFVCIPVRTQERQIHLMTASPVIWRERASRLVTIKRKAADFKARVLLLSPWWIQREPRLSNARMIESAFHTPVTCEDRMAVFMHLLSHGGYSCLHDCACAVVRSDAPYSAVLAMVGMGLLEMDLNKPVIPEARIDLPAVSA